MNVSRIWRRLVLSLTRRASYCSTLYGEHSLEMFKSQLSDRTHTHRPNTQQDGHLQYLPISELIDTLQLSEQSLKNTAPTSGTHFHVVAISSNGQIKASFYGTRSQLHGPISLFLLTGKSGLGSQEKSFNSSLKEVSYLHSLDQWRDAMSSTSTQPSTK